MKQTHKILHDFHLISEIEVKRKKLVFYFSSYFGSIILFLYALRHIRDDHTLMNYSLYAAFVLLTTNVLVSRRFENLQPFYNISASILLCFMVALVYTGGHESTGLYWTFPFPMIFFVLYGYRKAAVLHVFLIIFFSILLFSDGWVRADYSYVVKTRYLASFIISCVLCGIAEYFRFSSHLELTSISLREHKQANLDALTQLPNRRFIDSKLLKNIETHPEKYFPLCVVKVDLDNFKNINDVHGHLIGDQVLKHVSERFKQGIRSSDVVARVGGEEFLFVFPNASLTAGKQLAEKIRVKLQENPYTDNSIEINCTGSFGVSEANSIDGFYEAVKMADDLLYRSKKAGRNCVN